MNAIKLRRIQMAGGNTSHGWVPGLVSPPFPNLTALIYNLLIDQNTIKTKNPFIREEVS